MAIKKNIFVCNFLNLWSLHMEIDKNLKHEILYVLFQSTNHVGRNLAMHISYYSVLHLRIMYHTISKEVEINQTSPPNHYRLSRKMSCFLKMISLAMNIIKGKAHMKSDTHRFISGTKPLLNDIRKLRHEQNKKGYQSPRI